MAEHVSIKEKITAAVDKITPHRKSHGTSGTGTSDTTGNTRYGATDSYPTASPQVASVTATGVPVGAADAPPVAAPGVARATAAEVRVAGQEGQPGEVIDREVFTRTEDHERLVEKKRYELEHHPVQKQYVVETKYVGEAEVPGAATEIVGQERNVVQEQVKAAPAGAREIIVEGVDAPNTRMPGVAAEVIQAEIDVEVAPGSTARTRMDA